MALTWDQARQQASQQLDPVYKQALENVRQQTYENRLAAGNTAASRGLSHSGLAADLQNKVNIAGQRNMADLQAQRSAREAETAERMMDKDWQRGTWQQEFDYRKQRDTVGDARWQNEYDYRRHRDTVGDTRWQTEYDYTKALEEWRRQYLGQRDAVEDQQYADQLDLLRRKAQWEAYNKEQWSPYVVGSDGRLTYKR